MRHSLIRLRERGARRRRIRMDLDDLLGSVHRDRITSLRRQLDAVALEINTRRLVSADHHLNLREQLADVRRGVLRLLPENAFAADPHLILREGLLRESRTLEQEITDELRQRWRDLQALRSEQRRLREELLEELARYER